MSTDTPARAPAGRRRFGITVLCFALANLGLWFGYDQWNRSHSHRLLEVEQFSADNGSWPRLLSSSEAAQVAGRARLSWTFNLDVLPDKEAPGQIVPPVAGKWAWPDRRTLTFLPDAPLPPATRFVVSLSADSVRTPEGFRLAKPFEAAIETDPLTVKSVRQAAFDEKDRLVLEIEFNDEVIPAEVLSHLSVHAADGHPIGFHLHGEAQGASVRVLTDPLLLTNTEKDASVTVRLSPGLTGHGGPLAMTREFMHVLQLASDLRATEASAYCPVHGNPALHVRFNNDVDVNNLRRVISVTPAVPFTISSEYDGIQLDGPFQPATRYAITIARTSGENARHFPRPAVLSAFVPDRSPGVWFDHEQGYLGSSGNRTVMAHAVNVSEMKISATRIYNNNLVEWRNEGGRGRWRSGDALGKPLANRSLHLKGKKNVEEAVTIALDELLPADARRDGVYQIAVASSTAEDGAADEDFSRQRYGAYASTVVALSDIGLTAKEGRGALTVWATSLASARPLAGVHVRAFSSKNQVMGEATTDADGLAAIKTSPMPSGESAAVVIAQREEPAADAPAASTAPGLTWLDLNGGAVSFTNADTTGRPWLRSGFEAFVYTDRGVYRPGETVALRAIVRGPEGAVPRSFPVKWQILRPDLRDWKALTVDLDSDGAAAWALQLPADLPTGRWSARIGLPGKSGGDNRQYGSVSFQVEEFIPDRMKVALSFSRDGKPAAGPDEVQRVGMDTLHAAVQADYLFGRPVDRRPATLIARLDPAPFAPAGWNGWFFGADADPGVAHPAGRRLELPPSEVDQKGHAGWDLDLAAAISGEGTAPDAAPAARRSELRHRSARPDVAVVRPAGAASCAGPWRLTVTGSVIETGGRAVSATRLLDVDCVSRYVAVKRPDAPQSAGTPWSFDLALVSAEGKLAEQDAKLEITLFRESWNTSWVYDGSGCHYQSTQLLEPAEPAAQVFLTRGRGQYTLTPRDFGEYVLRVRDPQTGFTTSCSFCTGYGCWEDNISRDNPEKVDLLVQPIAQCDMRACFKALRSWDLKALRSLAAPPPRNEEASRATPALRVGQPAQVIIRSPFAGRLLLSVETDSVLTTRVIDMPASQMALPIDIAPQWRPGAYITASIVRGINPNAAWQPHRAAGVIRVPIDESDRRLSVELAAPHETRPSSSLDINLRITDSAGLAVPNAAITVAVVDEGICRLTGFETPDPFAFFTARRALEVRTSDLYGQLMPETPRAEGASAAGGDASHADDYDPRRVSPISAKRVKPVALVSEVLHSGPDGVARTSFNVPQFTGQLRIMAVAWAGCASGSAERPVLVRSPLLVQSSWPRFAAPGDRFTVPLVLFNNTGAAGTASVSVDLPDSSTDPSPLAFMATHSQHIVLDPVALAPGGQAAAEFDVLAADRAGVARARLTATMNGETYAETIELPVRPASPVITVGGYACASPAAPCSFEIPGGMLDGADRFEIHVGSWPLLEIPEGLDYLDRYPYGCAEQTTSTLFPLVYLSDIGAKIAPGLFDRERVGDKVQVGITRLISMQTADGGLSMWPGEREPWPWASVYAAHFLVEAKAQDTRRLKTFAAICSATSGIFSIDRQTTRTRWKHRPMRVTCSPSRAGPSERS